MIATQFGHDSNKAGQLDLLDHPATLVERGSVNIMRKILDDACIMQKLVYNAYCRLCHIVQDIIK